MRPWLFAANWKMNLTAAEAGAFVASFVPEIGGVQGRGTDWSVLLAPQAPLLGKLTLELNESGIAVAAQNCGEAEAGAFTGEISPVLLKELGCEWVILGHSERRHTYGEEDELIRRRMDAAWKAGLSVLLCVGETADQRDNGRTSASIQRQLGVLVEGVHGPLALAYEPVWAIGTGRSASPEHAEEVHDFIRQWVKNALEGVDAEALQILYGGSVKPENSEALMAQANVDGLLVGGASLDATKFADLIRNGLRCRA